MAAAGADDPEPDGNSRTAAPPTAGGTAAIDRDRNASPQSNADAAQAPADPDGDERAEDRPLIDPRKALNPLDEAAAAGRKNGADQHSTTNETDAPADRLPAHESQPIGEPAALFEDGQQQQSDRGSWLGSIDPRQNTLSRTVIALIGVVALIAGLAAVVRRIGGPLTGGGRPSGVIEILARYPIGRGQQLMILKMDRRVLLLHHAGTSMTPVSEVTDPDEVASLLARIEAGSRRSAGPSFADMLGRQSAAPSSSMDPSSSLRQTAPAPTGRPSSPGTSHGSGAETVDLTRSSGGLFGRLFGGGRSGS